MNMRFFLNKELPGLWNQFKDNIYQKSTDTREELDDKFHEAVLTKYLPYTRDVRKCPTKFNSASHH
jgi:hypothetical protein